MILEFSLCHMFCSKDAQHLLNKTVFSTNSFLSICKAKAWPCRWRENCWSKTCIFKANVNIFKGTKKTHSAASVDPFMDAF